MALNIEVEWHRPLDLYPGGDGLIYELDWDLLPPSPGIYVFSRHWGDKTTPFYVGRADNLQKRVRQQTNNLRLMKGLEDHFRRGSRRLLYATVITKRGQQIKKVLDIVERAYIEHSLSLGFDLLNKAGTKIRHHEISSCGRKRNHSPFPRLMNVRSR